MITFKDIMETKIAIKDAWDFKEKVCNTEASYDFMQTINTATAKQSVALIGRFFNLPKKAIVHKWKHKSKYGGTNDMELQISKSGIGGTYAGSRIQVYSSLFEEDSYYGTKGLVGDVIDDQEIYDKTFKILSIKGQDVLSALKESREVTKIKSPKSTIVKYPLLLSQEEQECFRIVNNSVLPIKQHAYIELRDDDREMVVEVKSKHAQDTEENQRDGIIFKVNSLDMMEEKDFQYLLFIHYHLSEFETALTQYIEKTKDHKDRWEKFKEMMGAKIAKYTILYKL
jgi:hypothetical protein